MCVWEHCYSEEISHVLIKDLVISFTMLLIRTVQQSDRTTASLFYLTVLKNCQCTTFFMSHTVFTEKKLLNWIKCGGVVIWIKQ